MIHSHRIMLPAMTLYFLLVAAVSADVPTEMNVQGRLLDAAGDPVAEAPRDFTFAIFDAEVGGTQIWPEGAPEYQEIWVGPGGLWNARIGAVVPLPAEAFTEPERWLEITVGDSANPTDTLARIMLNTNPFTYRAAISQHAETSGFAVLAEQAENAEMLDGALLGDIQAEIDADVAVHSASDDHGGWYVHVSGDTIYNNLDFDHMADGSVEMKIDVGGPALTLFNDYGDVTARLRTYPGFSFGQLQLYELATAQAERVSLEANSYGVLYLKDYDEDPTVQLGGEFGAAGGGTLILAKSNLAAGALLWAGNDTAGAQLELGNRNGYSRIRLDGDRVGDSAVILPDSSVSSVEMLNEPGVASAMNGYQVGLNESTMANLAICTLTIPRPGYIVVEGVCTGFTSGTTGWNGGYVQIDQTSGGGASWPYYTEFGAAGFASVISDSYPVATRRVYYKTAGTHVFHLEGMAIPSRGSGAYTSTGRHILTATYYPTSYGTVTAAVSTAEAGAFESVQTVTADTRPTGSPDQAYSLVDLRELEMRVLRARAESARAEQELVKARLIRTRLIEK